MAKHKVEPLRSKTLTLGELQLRVVDFLRKARFQFRRQAHEVGMSDEEFIDEHLVPLEERIYQDRKILQMYKNAKKAAKANKR